MLLYTNLIFAAVVLHQSTVANSSTSSQEDCVSNQCNREDQFCAGKSCLDHSRCMEDADCLNDSNKWMQMQISCVGPITCKMLSDVEGEPGYCSKSCDIMCRADKDCGEQQYCASGVCLDYTTCRGDKDCLESSNKWFAPACAGPTTCNDGSCGKTCDTLCKSNEECGEQQYCGADVCRDHKTCNNDVDCVNPSNQWGRLKCIGFDKCQDGFCGRTCGYHCENKGEREECLVPPCEENKYDDEFSCVNDYCGGCNAIVFDTAGNEVFPIPRNHHKPFKFSKECIERCPKVIGDWHTSKCNSVQIGDCDCPYEPDQFCQLKCRDDYPNWLLRCASGRPQTDDDTKQASSDTGVPFVPFETPPNCVEKCSEADLIYNGQCDFETMDDCRCVSPGDPYCFYECMENGLWAMACQLPPPPDDNRDNNDMPPYPTLETTTPVPTPAVRVGKKQSKRINKVRSKSEKAEKARKEVKQTI